jgi:hypothetical protein
VSVIKEIHLIGLAADRPTAAPTNEGYYWTSTDVAGGTTYRSNGTAWVAIAAGVSSVVTAHSALSGLTSGDDHTQYQKESEKGVANGYASLDSGILVPVAQLPALNALTPPTGDVSLNTHKITSLADPTTAQDAATKAYVDALLNGLVWKASVRAASTANGTLASAYENGDTLDGVTLATGDRILLKNQTAGAENGIYTVNASGAPTRAADADAAAELLQAAVFVREGTTNADTAWVLTTNGPLTVGTTALVFAQFNGGGGSSLTVREIDGTPSMTATVIEVTNAKLTDQGGGVARLDLSGGGGGGGLTIEEIDGTPSVAATTLKVTNGRLTDLGSGVAELDLSSGAAGFANPMLAASDIIVGDAGGGYTNEATTVAGASFAYQPFSSNRGPLSDAFDGNDATSVAAAPSASPSISIDLGSAKEIIAFRFLQTTYAHDYDIYSSDDAVTYTHRHGPISQSVLDSGFTVLASGAVSARYWLIQGGSPFGYWEVCTVALYSGTIPGLPIRLPVGANGQFLGVVGGVLGYHVPVASNNMEAAKQTPPLSTSGWTWLNQGTATVTDHNDDVVVNYPTNDTNLHALVRAVTAPFTVTAGFHPIHPISSVHGSGLTFYDSTLGRFLLAIVTLVSGVPQINVAYFVNATTYSSSPGSFFPPTVGVPCWMRFSDDGSASRRLEWSPNGRDWYLFHTDGRTSFMTASHVGMLVIGLNATMVLTSWQVT